MQMDRRDELITECHGTVKHALAWGRHPDVLHIAYHGRDIAELLKAFVEADLILLRQMFLKLFPGLSQFIAFNVEFCNYGVPEGQWIRNSALECCKAI